MAAIESRELRVIQVRGRLETGLPARSWRMVRSRHERTDALSQRPHRPPVGQSLTPVPRRRRPHRSAPQVPGPRSRQRGPLPGPQRLRLADAAARLSALEARVVLLLHLAGSRRLGPAARFAAAGCASAPRPRGHAVGDHRRFADGEDHGERRPEGVRRRKKKPSAASGT